MENMNNTTKEFKRGFLADVVEAENAYKIYCELPGFAKEDIQMGFDNSILTITAKAKNEKKKYIVSERNHSTLERRFSLEGINVSDIKAKYDMGILEVTVNLKKPEIKSIVIE